MNRKVTLVHPLGNNSDKSPRAPRPPRPHLGRRKSFYDYTRERMNQRLQGVKRCQFMVIFVFCFGILMFQAAQCVRKFLDHKTGTADKYAHVSKAPFPVLTICPPYPYDSEQLTNHGVTRSQIQWKANWISNQSDVDPVQFYDDVVLDLEKLVKHVDVYAEAEINGTNLFRMPANETFCGEKLFWTKPYYYNGNCFAFRLPSCLADSGVLELVLDFYDKMDIFIHHPGYFLNPNSRYS